MAQINHVLRYFACYFNQVGYMGEVSELKIPALKIKMEEFRGGGMDIPVDVDLGMEKLECEFKLFSYDAMILRRFGRLGQFQRTPVTFRGSLQGENALNGGKSSVGIKINLDVRVMELDFDNWKPASKTEVTIKCSVDYLEWFQNEELLVKIDPFGFRRITGGVDHLADARVHLGLSAGGSN